MIGWDEIVDAGISPSKALVMWWRHDRKYQLLKALEQGYQVVLTPRRPLYGDFVQDASHKVDAIWMDSIRCKTYMPSRTDQSSF